MTGTGAGRLGGKRRGWGGWLAALALAPAAWGQGAPPVPRPGPPTPEQALRLAFRFLTEGRHAPRRGLAEAAFRARAVVYPLDLGVPADGPTLEVAYRVAGAPRFVVRVTGAGRVVAYAAYDERLLIERWLPDRTPRPAAEVQEELQARWLYPLEELEQRGRDFLGQAYREFAARRFERVDSRRVERNPVEQVFVYEERPGPGVLAVYPNRIVLALNPETGRVTSFDCTDVEGELRQAPPVDAERARAVAGAVHPELAVSASHLLLILKGGRPVPVWACELGGGARWTLVLVDARTGLPTSCEED